MLSYDTCVNKNRNNEKIIMDENVRDKYYLVMQAACILGLKVYWMKI